MRKCYCKKCGGDKFEVKISNGWAYGVEMTENPEDPSRPNMTQERMELSGDFRCEKCRGDFVHSLREIGINGIYYRCGIYDMLRLLVGGGIR